MGYRKRPIGITIRVTESEKEMIKQRMAECGETSLTRYMRKMAIDGCVFKIDYTPIKEMTYEINKIGVNINQIAHVANSTGSVSDFDIKRLKELMEKIWRLQKSILSGEP